MAEFIDALCIQNFRGIGPAPQIVGPLQRINFFIGGNNTGKSTVLMFVYEVLPKLLSRSPAAGILDIPAVDKYLGGVKGEVRGGIGIENCQFLNNIEKEYKNRTGRDLPNRGLFESLVSCLSRGGFVVIDQSSSNASEARILYEMSDDSLMNSFSQSDWYSIWSQLTNRTGGNLTAHWIPEALRACVTSQRIRLPTIRFVPAIREIGARDEQFNDYSGRGLINHLAEIQSPDHDEREKRDMFDEINNFVKIVLSRPDARIEIPHNLKHILVHMDDKILPLSSLGTGIQEIIMLASFCTLNRGAIICIEEPELHLHPLLQRRFINYIRDRTDNQYLISTHSASFIDTPDAGIFHVSYDGAQTKIRSARISSDRYNICIDLGVRASDIVQSNAVVWVEGPSDRIYIKHWIKEIDPHLIEGVHFSVMFYGGRLLNHLAATDPEVTAFISLKALNQNFALVMDSDKAAAAAEINQTKQRLSAELSKAGSIAWITAGREIENYIPPAILDDAIRSVYGNNYVKPSARSPYDHALYFKFRKRDNSVTVKKDADKIAIARAVCEGAANLDILDLRDRISDVVKMIRIANHIDV